MNLNITQYRVVVYYDLESRTLEHRVAIFPKNTGDTAITAALNAHVANVNGLVWHDVTHCDMFTSPEKKGGSK